MRKCKDRLWKTLSSTRRGRRWKSSKTTWANQIHRKRSKFSSQAPMHQVLPRISSWPTFSTQLARLTTTSMLIELQAPTVWKWRLRILRVKLRKEIQPNEAAKRARTQMMQSNPKTTILKVSVKESLSSLSEATTIWARKNLKIQSSQLKKLTDLASSISFRHWSNSQRLYSQSCKQIFLRLTDSGLYRVELPLSRRCPTRARTSLNAGPICASKRQWLLILALLSSRISSDYASRL